eukprot:gene6672-18942_t
MAFEHRRHDPAKTAQKRACASSPYALRDRLQELIDGIPLDRLDRLASSTCGEVVAKLWQHMDGIGEESGTKVIHAALVSDLWPSGVSPAIPYLVVRSNEVAGLLSIRGEQLLHAVRVNDERRNCYTREGCDVSIMVRWEFQSVDNLEGFHLLAISNQVGDRCMLCDLPEPQWGDCIDGKPRTMMSMLRDYQEGHRRTPPRLAEYLAARGMAAELENVKFLAPQLHIILGTEKPLLGVLPSHVRTVHDREHVRSVLHSVTHNKYQDFSAETLVANMTGTKVRNAIAAHLDLFDGTGATGMIRPAYMVTAELNAVLYSPCTAPRAAVASYALVSWTYVAHLAPAALEKLYAHQHVAHLADLAELPVPPVWLSDDRGESLLRFVKQVVGTGNHDWELHTGHVLEWWRGCKRDGQVPGGGRPALRAKEPVALVLPPCMFILVAERIGVWQGAAAAGVALGISDNGALLVNPGALRTGGDFR